MAVTFFCRWIGCDRIWVKADLVACNRTEGRIWLQRTPENPIPEVPLVHVAESVSAHLMYRPSLVSYLCRDNNLLLGEFPPGMLTADFLRCQCTNTDCPVEGSSPG